MDRVFLGEIRSHTELKQKIWPVLDRCFHFMLWPLRTIR